jgi:hypothetical protein
VDRNYLPDLNATAMGSSARKKKEKKKEFQVRALPV